MKSRAEIATWDEVQENLAGQRLPLQRRATVTSLGTIVVCKGQGDEIVVGVDVDTTGITSQTDEPDLDPHHTTAPPPTNLSDS